MLKKVLVICGAVTLLFGLTSASAGATPSDGNGNKFVLEFEDPVGPIGCGDVELVVEFQIQVRTPEQGRNIFLTTVVVDNVYSNGAGETWVFKDRGADRGYLVDGALHIAVTGRSGIGNIGRLILVDPGPDGAEVIFEAGNAISPDDEACERLS